MDDLTDEGVEIAIQDGPGPANSLIGDRYALAIEVQRHRAANAYRIASESAARKSVGSDVTSDELRGLAASPGQLGDIAAECLRHRAAQRADAARIAEVVRANVLLVLEDQSATVARDNCVIRYGTAERRKALKFCADVIATRVAEQLAAPVLSAEERTRLDESDRVRLRNIIALLRQQPVCWDMEIGLLDRLLGGGR